MKRIALITTILLVSLILSIWPTRSADGEKDVLITLYDSTNGDSWIHNDGWKTDPDHCNWYGVTCDSGNVTSLNLSNNQLNGTIPPQLGNLSNLQYLHLYFNQLSGSIPPELGYLSNLQSLALYVNFLNGPIPPQLGNLSSLSVLALDANLLSGLIPPELGNLSNLLMLSLSSNQLSGPIPAELSNLSSLLDLYLNENPTLICWETQAALTWAQGLSGHYSGPDAVCQFIYLPQVTR